MPRLGLVRPSLRVGELLVCSTSLVGLAQATDIDKIGIIMSMHLYLSGTESGQGTLPTTNLRLLCAYESGSVILWKYTRKEKVKSVQGAGWEMVWNVKLHAESGTWSAGEGICKTDKVQSWRCAYLKATALL